MRPLLIFVLTTFSFASLLFAQDTWTPIKVSEDVEIIKITDNVYMHVSYLEVEGWGRVASNGMIYVNGNSAALFDTPMAEKPTRELVAWINDSLNTEIELFVPNHWHDDCLGGYGCLKEQGVKSYAYELTVQITDSLELGFEAETFKDSTSVYLGGKEIVLDYLGPAHALDNIITWLPEEKVLFAGCMAKGTNFTGLGNTADGNVEEYPNTLKKVMRKYPDAVIVIPGHGDAGGMELLRHTLKLAEKEN